MEANGVNGHAFAVSQVTSKKKLREHVSSNGLAKEHSVASAKNLRSANGVPPVDEERATADAKESELLDLVSATMESVRRAAASITRFWTNRTLLLASHQTETEDSWDRSRRGEECAVLGREALRNVAECVDFTLLCREDIVDRLVKLNAGSETIVEVGAAFGRFEEAARIPTFTAPATGGAELYCTALLQALPSADRFAQMATALITACGFVDVFLRDERTLKEKLS
jgi:hypothetical protein